jgi:hypothetical protein
MTEMVIFRRQTGLVAIVEALDAVRQMLLREQVTPMQAASYLGCLNLHLARSIGLSGDVLDQVEQCGGLLCPHCQAYVGFISDLSALCHVCGEPVFPSTTEDGAPASE